MISLDALNSMPATELVALVGRVFEHSPWIAERAAARRPFTSHEHVLDTMLAVVEAASFDEQTALIRAHPQLGARDRKRVQLTDASAREQRRAGLEACSDEEFAELLRLNVSYVEKFGFPFILAVCEHDPRSILANFRSRLHNDADVERRTALTQIGVIAGYRLAELWT
ncbi:MAG: 2-oxo-4-hydroxy-4-carboxy-5-ureidoimidazoline decarboxylase [Steroidobacteraceae bacterium]